MHATSQQNTRNTTTIYLFTADFSHTPLNSTMFSTKKVVVIDKLHVNMEIEKRFTELKKMSESFQVMLLRALFADDEPLVAEEGIYFFKLLLGTQNANVNSISYEDMDRALTDKSNKRVQEFLERHKETRLSMLREGKSKEKLKGKIGTPTKEGEVDMIAWATFIAQIIEDDIHYLVRKGALGIACIYMYVLVCCPPVHLFDYQRVNFSCMHV